MSVTDLGYVGPGQRDSSAGGLAKGWQVSCCLCISKHRDSTEPQGLCLPQASQGASAGTVANLHSPAQPPLALVSS